MNKTIDTSGGYIALLAVLVISTIFVFVSLQAMVQQRAYIDTTLSRRAYDTTLDATRGCAEIVLMRLRSDVSYTGGGIPFEGGSCSVEALSGTGSQNRSFEIHSVMETTRVSMLVRVGDLEDIANSLQWSLMMHP